MEYTRVEATVKRYKKTSKMKKVAKARRRALFLPAPVVAIFMWESKEERLVVAGMVPVPSTMYFWLNYNAIVLLRIQTNLLYLSFFNEKLTDAP